MRPAHCTGRVLTQHQLLKTHPRDRIERDRRSDYSLKKALLQLSSTPKVSSIEEAISIYFFEELQAQQVDAQVKSIDEKTKVGCCLSFKSKTSEAETKARDEQDSNSYTQMLEDYSSDSSSSIVKSLDEIFQQVSIPSKKIRIGDYLQSICPKTADPSFPLVNTYNLHPSDTPILAIDSRTTESFDDSGEEDGMDSNLYNEQKGKEGDSKQLNNWSVTDRAVCGCGLTYSCNSALYLHVQRKHQGIEPPLTKRLYSNYRPITGNFVKPRHQPARANNPISIPAFKIFPPEKVKLTSFEILSIINNSLERQVDYPTSLASIIAPLSMPEQKPKSDSSKQSTQQKASLSKSKVAELQKPTKPLAQNSKKKKGEPEGDTMWVCSCGESYYSLYDHNLHIYHQGATQTTHVLRKKIDMNSQQGQKLKMFNNHSLCEYFKEQQKQIQMKKKTEEQNVWNEKINYCGSCRQNFGSLIKLNSHIKKMHDGASPEGSIFGAKRGDMYLSRCAPATNPYSLEPTESYPNLRKSTVGNSMNFNNKADNRSLAVSTVGRGEKGKRMMAKRSGMR